MMNQETILFVDGGSHAADSFTAVLGREGRAVRTVSGVQAALEPLQADGVDAVVLALDTPVEEGMRFLQAVEGLRPGLPVIVLVGDGVVPSPAELLRAGAYGCLIKPVSPETLEQTLAQALSRSVPKSAGESKVSGSVPGGACGKPLGVSAGWRDVVKSVANAAAGNEPVLVVGEADTGKEEVARMLHRSSARDKGPFVRLNCFDLSVDPLEAGLATQGRRLRASTEAGFEGVFQAARTGTLFLHAVNFLSEAAQSQILRILRDRDSDSEEAHPSLSADVRVVASCSVDLEASVAAGSFSRDLFNEINRMTILVPPLRERVEDIQFLAEAFLEEFASILRKPARSFHPEAMALLESYRWPGNVRELRNLIERAVLLSETAAIPAACLPLNPHVDSSVGSRHDLNLRSVLAAEEKRTLIEALQRAHGVRREAARLLGIDPRNLVYFLRKYGLEKREERLQTSFRHA